MERPTLPRGVGASRPHTRPACLALGVSGFFGGEEDGLEEGAIGAEDEVVVEIGARRREGDEQVVVSIDGDYYAKLDVGDRIVVRQAQEDCRILKLGKLSFLEILRKKMQTYH